MKSKSVKTTPLRKAFRACHPRQILVWWQGMRMARLLVVVTFHDNLCQQVGHELAGPPLGLLVEKHACPELQAWHSDHSYYRESL
ncbi:hypothetical protein A6X21_06105 [Planctopirus hydrillae]|uniref:Uncharacterized protein n=1 Tax=Planctopirus hydrillae TaxID=1841610 RepID=A0A1C3EAC8_9PLAN|nr:hypothetical protein A6X21_06105 [Planctopirus hydrillae]